MVGIFHGELLVITRGYQIYRMILVGRSSIYQLYIDRQLLQILTARPLQLLSYGRPQQVGPGKKKWLRSAPAASCCFMIIYIICVYIYICITYMWLYCLYWWWSPSTMARSFLPFGPQATSATSTNPGKALWRMWRIRAAAEVARIEPCWVFSPGNPR